MEIIGRNSELVQFSTILENWGSAEPLWVHFQGESGSGKTHLISFILENEVPDFHPLFRFNFEAFSLNLNKQLKEIFRSIYKILSDDIEAFLRKYPQYLGSALSSLFKTNFDDSEAYSVQFQFELLSQIIAFISPRHKTVLIFENVNFANQNQTAILTKLLNSNSLAVLIITSGEEEMPEGGHAKLIRLEKLSAGDIRKFVGSYLNISDENALFITNHLQMKSKGIPRNIKFLLEAYYRNLVQESSPVSFDPKILQKLRINPQPEAIFRHLIKDLSEIEISVLSFLSQLADPFPMRLLYDINLKLGGNERLADIWIEKGYLKTAEFSDQTFVYIEWNEWQDFLNKNSLPKKSNKILQILGNDPVLKSLRYPLQLSNLYFDLGDRNNAIRLAYAEAEFFVRMGFDHRALERYNFLKRNISEHADRTDFREMVYIGMGELQKSLGLYENAFESYRELRDSLGKENERIWFDASLKMSEILLKMDAIAEARYLLNDLKIKKTATFFAKAFSHMLLGDMEKNLGRNDYALNKYEKAFSFVDQTFEPDFIYRIYSKLCFYYLSSESVDKLKSLFEKVNRLIPADSRVYFQINLELLKFYIDKKEIDRASELALKLYRQVKQNFHPGIMAQTILYLVDIYAFLGKWYLARSHLNQMLRIRLFITNQRIEVRILISLAAIQKEIAQYGNALKLLSKAEEICRKENLDHELYEIKLHKGHIQMLIHGYLRQREFLADALQWSEENHDQELLIMSLLYMSSYEVQQKRMEEAKNHLDEARSQINQSGNEIDRLNYIFYLTQYLLQKEQLRHAERVIKVWQKKSQGIAKFENLALWLEAKLLSKKGEHRGSLEVYRRCLERSRKYHLPHLEFHTLKEMIILCKNSEVHMDLKKLRNEIKDTFHNLLGAIGDEILKKQFHESREVGELANIGIEME